MREIYNRLKGVDYRVVERILMRPEFSRHLCWWNGDGYGQYAPVQRGMYFYGFKYRPGPDAEWYGCRTLGWTDPDDIII